MAQELKINQRISQRLTQQQLRFVRLLELNAPELDEAVERELEANPALEPVDKDPVPENTKGDETPYYLRRAGNSSPDSPSYDFAPQEDSESLGDVLRRQIDERDLPEDVAAMAKYIIGNIDSNGYLERSLDKITNDIAFSTGHDVPQDIAERAYAEVRDLEPAGVGALNLRDCLLLQLQRLPVTPQQQDALEIISNYFEAFSMRHSHKIISGMHISAERLKDANALILKLNPKPGAGFGSDHATAAGVIVPDFVVTRDNGELYISLNNRIPELAIEESFAEAMRGMEHRRGRPRKGTEFVNSRFNDAREFINVLNQRQQTMMVVITAIVNHQRAYFETGDVYLMKPMMLKDINKITGLDPSVISRATNNKYVSVPWGAVMPLRAFFSDTVAKSDSSRNDASKGDDAATPEENSNSGDVLTNRKIEAAIATLVEEEDKKHPLSDEKIRKELLKAGYDISRRTIAKYRDRQGILVARLRKTL